MGIVKQQQGEDILEIKVSVFKMTYSLLFDITERNGWSLDNTEYTASLQHRF